MIILIYFLFLKMINVYGSSVNSGCLVHDRGLSNFCNQVGCTKQSGHIQSYEPNILLYSNINQNNSAFVCKQNMKYNNIYSSKYEIAYTNTKNEFFIPYTSDTQYWYGPPFYVKNGTIELMLSNIDHNIINSIEIVTTNEEIYCGIYNEDLIENYIYKFLTNLAMYKIKVYMNTNDNGNSISCMNENLIHSNRQIKDTVHKYTIFNHTLRNDINILNLPTRPSRIEIINGLY